MEVDPMTTNDNKRTTPSSPTVPRNTEEDTKTDDDQNINATKNHKDLSIKKLK